MKLVLPTSGQFATFVKSSVIVGVVSASLVWFFASQDKNVEKIGQYLSANEIVIEEVGNIENTHLDRFVIVQDAIDYEGIETPGYSIYSYVVNGERGETYIKVRADYSSTGERDKYSILSIEPN